jgi:hypothetical protein
MAQEVECLPRKCKALNSIPGTAKKKKGRKEGIERGREEEKEGRRKEGRKDGQRYN